MIPLTEKIIALHHALRAAELPHAFGGALALAWCTGRARGTIDIDLNIFVSSEQVDVVVAAMPVEVQHDARSLQEFKKQGQVRFWWEHTPIDLFLNTTDFHIQASGRVRWETFMDQQVPFLCCQDLAVFKAFFNRTKDWADLEEMCAAGTIDVAAAQATLTSYLGAQDPRIVALVKLANQTGENT